MTSKETYFVLGGTGRQGKATINALVAKGVQPIVTTSRNPDSPSAQKLLEIDGVTKVLKADMTDVDSVFDAIKESGASRIWFTTDYYSLGWWPTRAKEAKQGTNVIDAILKVGSDQIKHVVYSSVGDADNCASNISHFWSKADVENYMKEKFAGKITYAIIRPVAFFDNVDDAKNFNPLSKGCVKMLTKPEVSLKYVATIDVGKGSAELLLDPAKYKGTPIEAAGGKHTGTELAQALTEVSGVDCTYSMSLPRWVLWFMFGDLYNMVVWFESDGYTADLDEFKKLVPDAMDAKAWFKDKGQWADGETFSAK